MAEGFLQRWSRAKQSARSGLPQPDAAPAAQRALAPCSVQPPPTQALAPAAAAAPEAQAAAAETHAPSANPAPALSLADAQALTPDCDFRPFVARSVAPEVRNLALKKLFSDPHFNLMDGLDIYIDDYSQPDPLPAGMLRKMVSAHALGFFDQPQQARADSTPAPQQAADPAQAPGSAETPQSTASTPIAQPSAADMAADMAPPQTLAGSAGNPPDAASIPAAPA